MSALETLAYAAPIVAVVVFLFTPPGQVVSAFLMGTKVGRWLTGAAIVAYAVLVAYSATYRAGRRAGSAAAMRDVVEANAEAKSDRAATEAKVAKRDDDALRRELSRYTPMLFAVIAIGLGGCAATTGGPGKGGAFCDVEKPSRLSAPVIAAMSHTELAAAVAHNRHGEKHCGWRP